MNLKSCHSCIAVTGANGYIGSRLVQHLSESGLKVRALVRSTASLERSASRTTAASRVTFHAMGDITEVVDWRDALQGVDVVVHAAGVAHRAGLPVDAMAEQHHAVNHLATVRLAEAAATAGVRRFVFLSSVAVYGDGPHAVPLSEASPCHPANDYGVSKRLSEQALASLSKAHDMQIASLRLPLVHGPGCGGNLRKLASLIGRGVPMPFGSIRSQRHLVGIDTLNSFVTLLAATDKHIDGVWNVADDSPVTLVEIIRALGEGLGRRHVRLLPIPLSVLMLLGRLTGRADMMKKLAQSMLLDSSAAREHFSWHPDTDTIASLVETGASFTAE